MKNSWTHPVFDSSCARSFRRTTQSKILTKMKVNTQCKREVANLASRSSVECIKNHLVHRDALLEHISQPITLYYVILLSPWIQPSKPVCFLPSHHHRGNAVKFSGCLEEKPKFTAWLLTEFFYWSCVHILSTIIWPLRLQEGPLSEITRLLYIFNNLCERSNTVETEIAIWTCRSKSVLFCKRCT